MWALVASVLLAVSLVAQSQPASQCATNGSFDSASSSCVCNPGFVGDGVFTCGIAHSFDIALSANPTLATGAIVALPIPTGASLIQILSIDASNSQFLLFQATAGSSQGAAIDLTQQGPWAVTNTAGNVFLQLAAGAPAGRFVIHFSYSLAGQSTEDALVVESYESCSGLDDLSVTKYGFTTAPELGAVDLSWLDSSYQLDFVVTAPYERDSAIVLIDTVDFDSLNDNIRNRPQGSCSAHSALPSSVPFHALFQSAPTATSTNALSGEYLAYPDPTSTGWDISAVNCSAVQYHRSFSLSELGSCNNVVFSTATDPVTNAALIKYAGSIFIHTLQPGDDLAIDESQAYAKFTQEFPFELQILTEFEALIQASTDQTRIHVVIRYLKLDGGDMVMQVETQVKAEGVETPAVFLSDGSGNVALIVPDLTASDAAPCLTNGEADICVQRWVYRKPSWVDGDNIVYNFQWSVYGTNNVDLLTVPISLKLRVNNVKVVVGKLGDLALRLYNELPDATTGSTNTMGISYPWHVNERIFVRGDVMTNPADVSSFSISYRELWVCYSPIAGYEISLANGGCLDPLLSDANRAHLLANGAVQTGLATSGFRAAVNTVDNGASSVAAGVSFDAFPLTGEPHIYTIHAKVLLQSKSGKKREIHTIVRREANSPSSAARMLIMPDPTENTNTNASTSTTNIDWVMVGVGGAGVFAVVGLVVVAAVFIRRSRAASIPTHTPVSTMV